MKKIIVIIISVIFLTSCGSSRKVSSKHQKTSPRRVLTHRKKSKKVKAVEAKLDLKFSSKNKIVYSHKIINDLYDRKPNLSSKKIAYIKKYSQLAIHEMEKYNIPASITLAQGLLESRYGESILTKNAKNHFGIKCHKWEGAKVYHDDDEKGECFRKYKYDATSYRDHSLFLYGKKRYSELFTYHPNDYEAWARGLRKAGYATDKKYPQKLIALIEEYELYAFDRLVLGKTYKSIPDEPEEEVKTVIIDSKVHIVAVGETLYAISKKYNVSVEKIIRINDLESNVLSVGQQLKMQDSKTNIEESIKVVTTNKTPKKIEKPIVKIVKEPTNYVVQKGDTIYSIAKKNKTTVDFLIKRNQLESDAISIGQLLIID
jgi:flagellum-specific peptidoglycan hydrolase FlgJ